MATTALQKFLNQLSKNKNVQNVVVEFNKLNEELKKKGSELNGRLLEEKEKTLRQAHGQYQKILSSVTTTQAQLDQEVAKALEAIRKSAGQVEKNLEIYRKKALAHKAKLEKALKARSTGGKKKTKKKVVKKPTSQKNS